MQQLELKYGLNPNQKPAKIFMEASELPVEVLSGKPGYINFMDALFGWQLVSELSSATGFPAAASFKHVSPAGAAIGLPLDDVLKAVYFTGDVQLSPQACAYARARGADRVSSYGDWAALSGICDASTARLLAKETSDGIIAAGYTDEALEILKSKKKGAYNIVRIDPDYAPAGLERRTIYGINFEQGRNSIEINEKLLSNIVTKEKMLTDTAKRDLIIALIILKYTQSNSVCYVKDGQAIGIGAGQQSRIHCTRLAGTKADNWFLRQHPKVLSLPFKEGLKRFDKDNAIDLYISEEPENVDWELYFTKKPEKFGSAQKAEWLQKLTNTTLGSDAFFPFGDNVERASRSGVRYIAQPGGSVRDENVIETCDKYGILMALTGMRLFQH